MRDEEALDEDHAVLGDVWSLQDTCCGFGDLVETAGRPFCVAIVEDLSFALREVEVEKFETPVEEVAADDAGPTKVRVLGREVCEVLSEDCFVFEERDSVLCELRGGVARSKVGRNEICENGLVFILKKYVFTYVLHQLGLRLLLSASEDLFGCP